MKPTSILAAAFIALAPVPAAADDAHHKDVPKTAAAGAPQLSEGEVRKIDKETGKITLRHGPIANLDMPAMSMVFQVKDPALLDQVKPGDKVKFVAEKIGGAFTVISIEPVRP
jgi:Cu(I)/Ag(I) efflux system protein CusF